MPLFYSHFHTTFEAVAILVAVFRKKILSPADLYTYCIDNQQLLVFEAVRLDESGELVARDG